MKGLDKTLKSLRYKFLKQVIYFSDFSRILLGSIKQSQENAKELDINVNAHTISAADFLNAHTISAADFLIAKSSCFYQYTLENFTFDRGLFHHCFSQFFS